MGQETMGKKDREKKKKQKQQEKAEKKDDRKINNSKGKSLNHMMAYIDENGNLSDTPPDPRKSKEMKLEDIQLGAAKIEPIDESEIIRSGSVRFFNHDKGYGFITDLKTQESIFVHSTDLSESIDEKDKVTFEIGKSSKGKKAMNVKKVG